MREKFAFLFLSIMLSCVVLYGFRGKSLKKSSLIRPLYMSTLVAEKTLVSHPSYQKVQDFTVQEYGLKGALYEHKKSGAQIISVVAPDDNKVFGISFRTPPADSTGVPHILEHSVLCGSRKFPVKEPFVDLLKGSLQNFLNAFTYPDRTCYPVASTNTKDFYNLIHVYLDAVLHPRAINDPQVLQQEGWHYELEDPQSPLKIKGVVYNEMKGVYSSPDSLMGRATQQALFPSNTYGVDSGGDPDRIPDLTFPEFKRFHSMYYHPANSRIFFYGDDDPLQRLTLLDEYLSEFDRIQVDSTIKYQSKLSSSLGKITIPFPVSPGTPPKHMVTTNWLLNDQALSSHEMLALSVLDYLLLGTSTSTLRKVLIDSQLGESVTGGGISDELLQSTFSVGLKGVKAEDVNKVEELVFKTLERVSHEGFEEGAIEAALNTLEFRLREFNTGSFPKGLSIMLGMLQHWIYDKNPLDGVTFEAPLKQLKDELAAKKPIFQELVKKYLLQNSHRVTVEMTPDETLEARTQAQEESLLGGIKESMTEKQLLEIVEQTKVLREAQEKPDSPEAKATIPALSLEDLEPRTRELPIDIQKDAAKGDQYTLLTHSLPTAGILYTDILLDYSKVAIDDIELLPLFSRLLMEAGTENYDETALTQKIGANTGGISVTLLNDFKGAHGKVANPDDAFMYLLMRGKAVPDKFPVLFDLFAEVLLRAKLGNQKRAVELLKESKVRKEAAVITSGHSFASTRLAAQHSFLGYFGEVTGGLTSVRAAGKLLELAEKDWGSVQQRLERIRQAVLQSALEKQQRSLIINLTGDEQILQKAYSSVESFVQAVRKASSAPSTQKSMLEVWKEQKKDRLLPARNEGFVVPSQVNYVAKGGSLYQPNEPVPGSSTIVARYLSTGYMWDQVRVLGGAYGGFARFNEDTGRFVYLSYRDPNLLQTLQAYDNAPDFLTSNEVTEEEVLQNVIGSIGDIDSPLSADQKGYAALIEFLQGETAEERQRWRESILKTCVGDFADFSRRLKEMKDRGSVVVFGSQQAIDQANAELPQDKKLLVEPAIVSHTAQ